MNRSRHNAKGKARMRPIVNAQKEYKDRGEEIFPLYEEINKISVSYMRFLATVLLTLNSGGIVFLAKHGIDTFFVPISMFSAALVVLIFFFIISYSYAYTSSFSVAFYITQEISAFDRFISRLFKLKIDGAYKTITSGIINQIISSHRFSYISFIISAIFFEGGLLTSMYIFYI